MTNIQFDLAKEPPAWLTIDAKLRDLEQIRKLFTFMAIVVPSALSAFTSIYFLSFGVPWSQVIGYVGALGLATLFGVVMPIEMIVAIAMVLGSFGLAIGIRDGSAMMFQFSILADVCVYASPLVVSYAMRQREYYVQCLCLLSPIHSHLCPKLYKWCETHPQLDKYRVQVAAQRRVFTNGEYKAAETLLVREQSRASDETARRYFELIKTLAPISAAHSQ